MLAQEEGSSDVRYITDQLRLSLYKKADSDSKVIETLGSGDKLTVEETEGRYAKVVTAAGNRGWVKSGYLVLEPTAGILVEDLEQKNDLLKLELERLNDSKVVIDQYETDMDSMSQTIEGLKAEKLLVEQTIAELEQQAQAKQREEQSQPALSALIKSGSVYWHYVAMAVLSLILIGILVGKRITETTIKKKFHGIKVW